MSIQPGLQMRKLTGNCSWAGTTQPDSTWTLQKGAHGQELTHLHTPTVNNSTVEMLDKSRCICKVGRMCFIKIEFT